jgi:hypothetical protein
VLVDQEAWEHGQATARTRQLMADRSVGAIFEAAFEHAGVRVRVDVLERLGPRIWGLREVKQGASVKRSRCWSCTARFAASARAHLVQNQTGSISDRIERGSRRRQCHGAPDGQVVIARRCGRRLAV